MLSLSQWVESVEKNIKVVSSMSETKSQNSSSPLLYFCQWQWREIYPSVPFRVNAGQIKGYEADVGTRTTHRVMYPESSVDLDNTTHLVLAPFKILDLEWLTKALTTGFKGRWVRFLWTTWLFVPSRVYFVNENCDEIGLFFSLTTMNQWRVRPTSWAQRY